MSKATIELLDEANSIGKESLMTPLMTPLMTSRSMGEIIGALRREKGLTQKELADILGITDKAVSKWERDVTFPDTATIPRLAEVLGISVEELMSAKIQPVSRQGKAERVINLTLKSVPVAMGIAVVAISLLGELDTTAGITMLGIGLICTGLYLLNIRD